MTFSWYPRTRRGRRDAFPRAGVGREAVNKDFLIAELNMLWWEAGSNLESDSSHEDDTAHRELDSAQGLGKQLSIAHSCLVLQTLCPPQLELLLFCSPRLRLYRMHSLVFSINCWSSHIDTQRKYLRTLASMRNMLVEEEKSRWTTLLSQYRPEWAGNLEVVFQRRSVPFFSN